VADRAWLLHGHEIRFRELNLGAVTIGHRIDTIQPGEQIPMSWLACTEKSIAHPSQKSFGVSQTG
jgi:hypothetical protein